MPFPSITAVDCLVVLVSIYFVLVLQDHRRRGGLPYPPGPQSWPIIGNLLDVPSRHPWAAYAEMSKTYGDVMSFRVFGQVVVVLSSSKAIKELLELRGETYSDRPSFPLHQILGLDWLLPILPKGEEWSQSRKLLDRSLRPAAPISYRRMMEEKTRAFLSHLLETPKEFRNHIELLQGKLIMSVTYGYDLKSYNDEFIEAPVELNKILSKIVLPGAVLINHIPYIKYIHSWIPFLSYEELARKCRELGQRMRNGPIEFVRNAMLDGAAVPSLASEQFEDVEHLSEPERQKQEKVIQQALGSLFNAGSDTTVSSMVSLFLALTLYPGVQKRAQRELDSVLGRDRLPTFDDRPRLPYIDALCKEVLRWRMVVPLGFPHAASQDGVYKGFFIPKGATILANAWGVLHDPELYPDPETFNPGRFLPGTAAASASGASSSSSSSSSGPHGPRACAGGDGDFEEGTPALGRRQGQQRMRINDASAIPLAFGGGKRICPGRHFVDATLFILAASVLAVFDVSKPKGEEESASESGATVNGLIASPGLFGCSIVPRDKLAEHLITANAIMG